MAVIESLLKISDFLLHWAALKCARNAGAVFGNADRAEPVDGQKSPPAAPAGFAVV